MINIQGFTKYYHELCAVDNINLRIDPGEIVGLLGPNAAGKTTTLLIMTGYLSPSAGNVQIKNYDLSTDKLKIKQLIGYLPENTSSIRESACLRLQKDKKEVFKGTSSYTDYPFKLTGYQGNKIKDKARSLVKTQISSKIKLNTSMEVYTYAIKAI